MRITIKSFLKSRLPQAPGPHCLFQSCIDSFSRFHAVKDRNPPSESTKWSPNRVENRSARRLLEPRGQSRQFISVTLSGLCFSGECSLSVQQYSVLCCACDDGRYLSTRRPAKLATAMTTVVTSMIEPSPRITAAPAIAPDGCGYLAKFV